MVFLTFLIIPLIVCLAAWLLTNKITWKEFLVQIGIQLIVLGVMTWMILGSNTSDQEVWNGQIVKKWSAQVSCDHSYKCHCYQSCSNSCDSKGHCTQSCHEICQTCYEHDYDVEWRAKNNLEEVWYIRTIDRQGLREPPRWTSIQIGEPTSSTHHYENFIKGSPGSLFHKTELTEEELNSIPPYPIDVFDYWKLKRLVQIGVSVPDSKEWNEDISKISADLGFKKQVNIVVVLVKNKPADYFYTLERAWVGGKKNDVIAMIGLDGNNNIQWADTMSLSNEEFKVYLRNSLINLKSFNRGDVIQAIQENVDKFYTRKPMKDFEYLSAAVKPTKVQWVWGMIFGFLLSVGLSFFFYYQDPFGDDVRKWR